MKNLNKETRGILSGAYSFVGQVGTLLFSLIGGWMFDNLGSKSPFVAIGILDFGFTIVFCAFMLGQRGARESEEQDTPSRLYEMAYEPVGRQVDLAKSADFRLQTE